MKRALLFAVLCAAAPLHAQSRIWQEDQRILVTSFNDVRALTFDGRRVIAASTEGLEIYDMLTRRWEPPATFEDGFPVGDLPVAVVYDRSYGGTWLLVQSQSTYFRSDLNGRWELRPFMSADSLRGVALRQLRAVQSDASWRVLQGSATRDALGRRWAISSAAPSDRSGVYWAGTAGNNILLADARTLRVEWQTYGTLSRGTGAIAVAGDVVWFGSDGLGPRDGLTRADTALQRWSWSEPLSARAPRGAVHSILIDGTTIYAGGRDGLYALTGDARSWQRADALEDVTALARTSAGIWAGTAHGLALVEAGTMKLRWNGAPAGRVRGLAVRNDSVWVASSDGLLIATVRDSTISIGSEPEIATSVAAVAGRIAALTARGITLDGSVLNDAALVAVGRPLALRGAAHSLFVIGARGVARWRADNDTWSYLMYGADIPAQPVTDVAASGPFVWLATPAGAWRVLWP